MELDLKQMIAMVDIIAEEKGIEKDTVLDIIQQAIAAAWRKDNGDKEMNVRSELDLNTGKAMVYVMREVTEDGAGYNPVTEIPQKEAGEDYEVGDIVEEAHEVGGFGRVASMTAKQVVIQRLHEAERDAMLSEYEDKIGTVVSGTVVRVEPKLVRIDLGKATGIMPKSEQVPGEYYAVGTRLKVLLARIDRNERGAQLILSRSAKEFVEYLFRQEVPEVENGTVEMKAIAREAGRRTKVAVVALVPGIDPVGTFVGGRGVRVQAVMSEIGEREKIDIVSWSDNPSEYLREALSPAEIQTVEIDGKHATVYVTKEQQSIAIGRVGQNVRLASVLTGYDIDVEVAKAPEKKKKQNVEDALLSAVEDVEEETGGDSAEGAQEEAGGDSAEGAQEEIESDNAEDAQEEIKSDSAE